MIRRRVLRSNDRFVRGRNLRNTSRGSTTSAASFACVKPDHDDGDHNKEASNR